MASSGGLGTLSVDLLLEVAQWAAGLGKAEKDAEKFANNVNAKLDAMGERALSAMKGMAAGIVAGFAVDSIAGFVNETQKAADALDEMAQKTGTSVEFLAGMSVAAGMAGSSVEGVAASFGKFSENVNKAFADPTSNPARIFKELGISVKDSAGHLKSSETIYQEVAAALGKMEDGAIKTAAAKKLLGKSGAELIPTFNTLARQSLELTAATNDYKKAMKELAPVAGALEEQQTIMATNQKTMAAVIGKELIPYFTTLIAQWNEATKAGGPFSGIVTGLMNAFKGLLIFLDAVVTTIKNLITMAVASVQIVAALKDGDFKGAGKIFTDMTTSMVDSAVDFEQRFGTLLGTLDKGTPTVMKLTKATNGLGAAVADTKDGAKEAAKAWEELSKKWVKSIDDAIEAERKMALAGDKAQKDREKAAEKESKERHEDLAKALTEEQKIMNEAYLLGAKFRADERAKELKEWEKQYGEMYRAIEDMGERAFMSLFDDTKGGWDAMLKDMAQSFKKILLKQIYDAFVKPFVMQIAAQMTGKPGAAGGTGTSGGGMGNLGQYADQAYNYYNQNWGAGSYAEGGSNFVGPLPEGFAAANTGGLGQLSWTSNAGGAWGGAAAMGAGVVGGAFGGWAANQYGAGERGVAAAQNYAAMGATIGMQVYGPIGAIVGAIIGTVAGIATDPDPDAMRKAVFGNIHENTKGVTKWTGESQFGKFGFSEGEWLSDEQMDPSMQAAIAGIKTLDNTLAQFMTDEQVENVKKKLDEVSKAYELGMEHLDVTGLAAVIKDRLVIITGQFHEGLSQFVAKFEGDTADLVTIVTSFMQLKTSAEKFDIEEIIKANKPLGFEEGYIKQRGALEDFLPGLDTSAESMLGLVSAMEAFQVAAVQMVMAIDAASAAIHAGFMNTTEQIKRSVMTPEEEYAYLQKQTDDLYAQLATETDPAKIKAITDKINSNIMEAWNLLTPEQQQAQAQSFIDRIAAVDAYVTDKMTALRAVVVEDAEDLMDDVAARLEEVFKSAEKAGEDQRKAADTNLEAARTPVVVIVQNGRAVDAAG